MKPEDKVGFMGHSIRNDWEAGFPDGFKAPGQRVGQWALVKMTCVVLLLQRCSAHWVCKACRIENDMHMSAHTYIFCIFLSFLKF